MIETGNETDVREEIATPLLDKLGYKRGTSADIAREPSLRYDRIYLGRKKPTDSPLRGRADYILAVLGAGRWVLEVKAPDVDVDQECLDQALSYARHPEVGATYAAVLNGKRFVLQHTSRSSKEPPVVDLLVESVGALAATLEAVLSPAAIRRDCSPPRVDLGEPLAEGLRSSANVLRGQISHDDATWSANIDLSQEQAGTFDEMIRRLMGLRVTVTGGTVERDAHSRIRARLEWSMPHDEMVRFALDKRLMDADYVALTNRISATADHPTLFDVVGEVQIAQGEPLFDMASWTTEAAGMDVCMRYGARAAGVIEGLVFRGRYRAHYDLSYPALPFFGVELDVIGTFEVELDGN